MYLIFIVATPKFCVGNGVPYQRNCSIQHSAGVTALLYHFVITYRDEESGDRAKNEKTYLWATQTFQYGTTAQQESKVFPCALGKDLTDGVTQHITTLGTRRTWEIKFMPRPLNFRRMGLRCHWKGDEWAAATLCATENLCPDSGNPKKKKNVSIVHSVS